MKRVCVVFAVVWMGVLSIVAQNGGVPVIFQGRVVNTSGFPIKDATVECSNTKNSVVTGNDGLFSLTLPPQGGSIKVSKEGLTSFTDVLSKSVKGVIILDAGGSSWMDYDNFVRQMAGTAKVYYDNGLNFLNGDDSNAPDFSKAFACFWRAANMEYVQAAYQLGKMFDEGKGIAQDYATAIKWYEKATSVPEACMRLATMYAEGIGVEKDEITAELYKQMVTPDEKPATTNQTVQNEQPQGQNIQNGTTFEVVETNAEFPGGNEACFTWLAQHIKYPAYAQEYGIQGTVVVRFVINKDGTVTDVEVMRSPDPSLSKEAERVVLSMPKWKPATQGGKTVRSRFNMPIHFRLNKKK